MPQAKRPPFLSLILLIVLALTGALLFTTLGVAISGSIYGFRNTLYSISAPASWERNEMDTAILRIIQIFSSCGIFIVPALFFAKIEGEGRKNYLKLNTPSYLLITFTALIMVASMPILEWVTTLNQKMELPHVLKGVEQWMRNKEDATKGFVHSLLIMHTPATLFINLCMIAIIPAVGEELIFRGCLQHIFRNWTGSQHISIWIVAFIFSAIHLQFFGFFPRMLLGALLGYLLLWSGSLYVPIFAHFINNAAVVIASYIYQQRGLPIDQIDQTEPSVWYMYLLSFAATITLLYSFYKISLNQRQAS